jgi:hypothetical protein
MRRQTLLVALAALVAVALAVWLVALWPQQLQPVPMKPMLAPSAAVPSATVLPRHAERPLRGRLFDNIDSAIQLDESGHPIPWPQPRSALESKPNRAVDPH